MPLPALWIINHHRIQVAISLLSNSVFVAADQVRLACVWTALIEVGTHAIAPAALVEQHRAPPGETGQLRFTIKNFDFIMRAEGEWVCQHHGYVVQ